MAVSFTTRDPVTRQLVTVSGDALSSGAGPEDAPPQTESSAPGAPVEPPAGEPPPSAPPAEPPGSPGEGESPGDQDEPDLPEDAPVTASHFNRRIGQITRYRREAERALAAERQQREQERAEIAQLRGELAAYARLMQGQSPDLGAPAQPQGPPQAEQFQSQEEYYDARADWRFDQKLAAQHQQQQQAEMQRQLIEREAAFKAQHPDFDDLVRTNLAGKVAPHVQQALMLLPEGPALAYTLAQQPDVVTRLNTLPPPLVFAELGRLSPAPAPATTTTTGTAPPAPVPAPPAPALPPPPQPLSGSGQGAPQGVNADMPAHEFRKLWNSGWRPSPQDFGR